MHPFVTTYVWTQRRGTAAPAGAGPETPAPPRRRPVRALLLALATALGRAHPRA